MNIGTLLSGAGRVSTGVRQREDELRQARLDQLAVEEANRANRARQEMSQAPMPETGDFGGYSEQLPVLPGLQPPAAAAPAAPAAPATAGVKISKPRPAVTGTVGWQEAMKNVQPGQLTRDRFLALPKAEQQRIFLEYQKQVRDYNRPLRGMRDEFGVKIPTGIPERPILSFEQYVESLPQQYGGPTNARGRSKKAGVAVPGNFAMDADTAIQNVLRREGGYVNDPEDAGGETKYGISKAANPDVDVANLTPEQAAQIYKAKYWDAIDADNLPPELREAAFDAAVNQGVPFTRTALANSGRDLNKFLALRKQRYDSIVAQRPEQRKFYDGWMARLSEFAGGMLPVAAAQADTLPAPAATLAATGPALQQIVGAGAGPAPQQKPPTQFYLANPEAISQDMQLAQQQRAELVRMAGIYQRAGMGQQYMELRQQIMALDANLLNLAGVQGVRELESFNDPRRLAKVWSIKMGQEINFQPRQDGTFDVLVNGRVAAQAQPRSEIMNTALSMFDQSYRDRVGARSDKQFESGLKINELMAGETGKMIREIYVAQQQGNINAALEQIKANAGWDIKGPSADGTYLIRPPGETPFYFDPAGGVVEIDGVQVSVTGARRIPGLNVGR